MVSLENLRRAFADLSLKEPRYFSAPGRVNLIGEHTDYNEGFVLPIAASLRTYLAAAPRDDGQVRVLSLAMNETANFSIAPSAHVPEGPGWPLYVQGVAKTLIDAGFELRGADIAIFSEVPVGAGLSSSAALEIATGFALMKLSGLDISLTELARAAQRAEQVFVGTNSGLMDQLTATHAKKNHALFIDCRSVEIEHIPVQLPDIAIVICDTRVKHALATSDYNLRREECEYAVALVRKHIPEVRALRDLTTSDLIAIECLPEPIRSRARHVITENNRTVQAASALKTGNALGLGSLMVKSHESLRDDFEVSCRELDVMFELAMNHRAVLGSRMMGAGFGGCTINLVEDKLVDDFVAHMTSEYQRDTGLVPLFHIVTADEGVKEIAPGEYVS